MDHNNKKAFTRSTQQTNKLKSNKNIITIITITTSIRPYIGTNDEYYNTNPFQFDCFQ